MISSSGNSVNNARGGGKRGILFLVSILLIIQLISWRGTSKLKAVSLVKRNDGDKVGLYKRQISIDQQQENISNQINEVELDWSIDLNQKKTNKKNEKDDKKSNKKHEKDDKKSNKKHEKDEKKKKEKNDKKHSSTSSSSQTSSKSSSTITSTSSVSNTASPTIECHPLPTEVSPQKVCKHVRQHCPSTGHLNYLEFFFCIGLPDSNSTSQTAKAQATPAPLSHFESDNLILVKKQKGLDTRLKWLRAMALTCIIAWMLFLFSWVGIVASDFFCPNLSNLAARLGMSESTAGVTFLAFGNGSPDVFSTFGAMRTGSGSLAIGELIGAASFIVSVISGSMMLIAPFRVKPFPFLRDVGFFTVAVSLTMTYLIDGKLRFTECLSMIALYVLYATTIIIGSWWQERSRQRRVRMANIRSENSFTNQSNEGFNEELERQTPSSQPQRSPIIPYSAIEYEPDVDPFVQWAIQQDTLNNASGHLTPTSNLSTGNSPLMQPVDLPTGSSGGSNTNHRLRRFRAGVLARHSLLGAVEFRDVVRSLRQESGADQSMEIYQSRDPERFLPHPQHHSQIRHLSLDADQGENHKHKRAKSLSKPRKSATNTDYQASLVRSRSTIGSSADHGPMADVVRPNLEQVGQHAGLAAVAAAVGDPWKEHGPADGCEEPVASSQIDEEIEGDNADVERHQTKPTLPRLSIRRATGSSRSNRMPIGGPERMYESPFSSKEAFFRAVKRTRRALFPSLRHFREKSWLGIIIGLVTAPAILLLKITLPVVDDEAEQAVVTGEKNLRSGSGSGQIRLAGDESPLLAHQSSIARIEDEDEGEDDDVTGGRGVIDLSSENHENPWDASRTQSEVNEEDENSGQDNRKRQLHVSSVLRNLPEEGSPLLFSSPSPQAFSVHMPNQHQRQSSTTRPMSESEHSWQSDDSHVTSSTQNLFLIVAQCAFAPPFCVWAITSSAQSKHVLMKTLIAFICGVGISIVVFLTSMQIRHNERPSMTIAHPALIAISGWTRVAVGFFVSILYIMTIVDEVVSILQTLGLILGLSDAILGLTVFAMGNSLGDLVANITIAKMGHPVMAISACFAGPLLNLLLGIGISGSWLLSRSSDHSNHGLTMLQGHHSRIEEPGVYYIDFSPTLTVSGFGLLLILVGTLILVPLNGFYLDRRIGSTLIITYVIIMCVNIGVELYSIHGGI